MQARKQDSRYCGDVEKLRREANAIVAYAFRNTYLEELHVHISEQDMQRLIMDCCQKMEVILHTMRTDPKTYTTFIHAYGALYCSGWECTRAAHTKRRGTTYANKAPFICQDSIEAPAKQP